MNDRPRMASQEATTPGRTSDGLVARPTGRGRAGGGPVLARSPFRGRRPVPAWSPAGVGLVDFRPNRHLFGGKAGCSPELRSVAVGCAERTTDRGRAAALVGVRFRPGRSVPDAFRRSFGQKAGCSPVSRSVPVGLAERTTAEKRAAALFAVRFRSVRPMAGAGGASVLTRCSHGVRPMVDGVAARWSLDGRQAVAGLRSGLPVVVASSTARRPGAKPSFQGVAVHASGRPSSPFGYTSAHLVATRRTSSHFGLHGALLVALRRNLSHFGATRRTSSHFTAPGAHLPQPGDSFTLRRKPGAGRRGTVYLYGTAQARGGGVASTFTDRAGPARRPSCREVAPAPSAQAEGGAVFTTFTALRRPATGGRRRFIDLHEARRPGAARSSLPTKDGASPWRRPSCRTLHLHRPAQARRSAVHGPSRTAGPAERRRGAAVSLPTNSAASPAERVGSTYEDRRKPGAARSALPSRTASPARRKRGAGPCTCTLRATPGRRGVVDLHGTAQAQACAVRSTYEDRRTLGAARSVLPSRSGASPGRVQRRAA
jgi:hypothetical protein